ncbi:hypothetical protein F3Y22_tig00110505pilonHSYRG00119 [Hibiscus syriacus]|uniref:DNA (Cytosine-5)-methyltransferase DRM1/2 n=1 Tax=Hibiscus syriacus TaxID=106335 RepID=A0A6A3AB49_HIBSY|nr:hypothetical protein F3Y22_tig00110505pilonHSYRG00119 [Hibiscus syriacus]
MGYSKAEASIAMERCGPDSLIAELTDFICTAQMAKAVDALLPVEDRKLLCNDLNYKQRQNSGYDFWKGRKRGSLKSSFLMKTISSSSSKSNDWFWGFYRTRSDNSKNTSKRCYWASLFLLRERGTCSSFPKTHTRGGGSARDMFPGGINVLSLFSGISDAQVVFCCLGIPLKIDAQELNGDRLEQLMSRFGKFDLVVGGIQYNNLTEEINIIGMN